MLWFWCVKDAADSCQRTLEVRPRAARRAGAPLAVTVRGYDEHGRGVPVEGATVRLGGSAARDRRRRRRDGDGARRRPHRLQAEKPGMVVSFPVRVEVG